MFEAVISFQPSPLSIVLIISSFCGIVWSFVAIIITQTNSNVLHSTMEIKFTATLLIVPSRKCDLLVTCSATRVWDPAFRNFKYSAWRESLCWQHSIQIVQYKIMQTTHTWSYNGKTCSLGAIFKCWKMRVAGLSDGGLKEFCCVFIWTVGAFLPSYTQHYSIASQKKPILFSKFLIYILGSSFLSWCVSNLTFTVKQVCLMLLTRRWSLFGMSSAADREMIVIWYV